MVDFNTVYEIVKNKAPKALVIQGFRGLLTSKIVKNRVLKVIASILTELLRKRSVKE